MLGVALSIHNTRWFAMGPEFLHFDRLIFTAVSFLVQLKTHFRLAGFVYDVDIKYSTPDAKSSVFTKLTPQNSL